MPEIAGSLNPEISRIVSDPGLPHLIHPNDNLPGRVDIPYREMQRRLQLLIADAKRKFTDVPEGTIDIIADIIGGPYRLDRKLSAESQAEKEISARIQHEQVAAMLHVALGNPSDAFVKAMYSIASTFENIYRSDRGEIDATTKIFWSGVRSELATVKALTSRNSGFRVFLPDYTQDPLEVDDRDNEVLQWDVRHGIDLLAIRDGVGVLVDAKGRNFQRETVNGGKLVQWMPCGNVPQVLNDYLHKSEVRKVKRARVYIPTDELDPLYYRDKIQRTPDQERDALRAFCNLRVYREQELLTQLNEGLNK